MYQLWFQKINIKFINNHHLIGLKKLLLEDMENQKSMEIKLIIFLVIGIKWRINMSLIDTKIEKIFNKKQLYYLNFMKKQKNLIFLFFKNLTKFIINQLFINHSTFS